MTEKPLSNGAARSQRLKRLGRDEAIRWYMNQIVVQNKMLGILVTQLKTNYERLGKPVMESLIKDSTWRLYDNWNLYDTEIANFVHKTNYPGDLPSDALIEDRLQKKVASLKPMLKKLWLFQSTKRSIKRQIDRRMTKIERYSRFLKNLL